MQICKKNYGKKSFWGGDLINIYANNMMENFIELMAAMHRDRLIDERSSVEDVLSATDAQMTKMKMSFPNWQDAYTMYDAAFKKNQEAARTIAAKFIASL